jgi:hypothetical protein
VLFDAGEGAEVAGASGGREREVGGGCVMAAAMHAWVQAGGCRWSVRQGRGLARCRWVRCIVLVDGVAQQSL